ncbi:Uu.00g065130.m01.CDS01 [Anthostomella pinea]|uniref:Uu.00g065130.m01.CDS01 n=1 Tax=Anthostomella pinea TaxID=933095 RepID=A0AAI8VUX6_9PEZI|nr:Uu.00g065130.m01.CDS01 [Anthostomella pinea]
MSRAPGGRDRAGGGGFAPVPQIDATDDDDSNINQDDQQGQYNGQSQRRRFTAVDRFRDTVQHVIRQSTIPHEQDWLSVGSSPALSDTTLVGADYLDLPIQRFDEVDLGDYGSYVEYRGYYGPEVTHAVDTRDLQAGVGIEVRDLSYSKSLKAGLGIEVRVKETALDYSPGGLYIDFPTEDYGYRGSEGIVEKHTPSSPADYNYKPLSLKWLFLFLLFGALLFFVVIAGLALRLLPDASKAAGTLPAFQNITEIRRRSILPSSINSESVELLPFGKRQNNTDSEDATATSTTTDLSTTIVDAVTSVSTPAPSVTSHTSTSTPSVEQPTSATVQTTTAEETTAITKSLNLPTSTANAPSTSTVVTASEQGHHDQTTSTTTQDLQDSTTTTTRQTQQITTTSQVQSTTTTSQVQMTTTIGPNQPSTTTEDEPSTTTQREGSTTTTNANQSTTTSVQDQSTTTTHRGQTPDPTSTQGSGEGSGEGDGGHNDPTPTQYPGHHPGSTSTTTEAPPTQPVPTTESVTNVTTDHITTSQNTGTTTTHQQTEPQGLSHTESETPPPTSIPDTSVVTKPWEWPTTTASATSVVIPPVDSTHTTTTDTGAITGTGNPSPTSTLDTGVVTGPGDSSTTTPPATGSVTPPKDSTQTTTDTEVVTGPGYPSPTSTLDTGVVTGPGDPPHTTTLGTSIITTPGELPPTETPATTAVTKPGDQPPTNLPDPETESVTVTWPPIVSGPGNQSPTSSTDSTTVSQTLTHGSTPTSDSTAGVTVTLPSTGDTTTYSYTEPTPPHGQPTTSGTTQADTTSASSWGLGTNSPSTLPAGEPGSVTTSHSSDTIGTGGEPSSVTTTEYTGSFTTGPNAGSTTTDQGTGAIPTSKDTLTTTTAGESSHVETDETPDPTGTRLGPGVTSPAGVASPSTTSRDPNTDHTVTNVPGSNTPLTWPPTESPDTPSHSLSNAPPTNLPNTDHASSTTTLNQVNTQNGLTDGALPTFTPSQTVEGEQPPVNGLVAATDEGAQSKAIEFQAGSVDQGVPNKTIEQLETTGLTAISSAQIHAKPTNTANTAVDVTASTAEEAPPPPSQHTTEELMLEPFTTITTTRATTTPPPVTTTLTTSTTREDGVFVQTTISVVYQIKADADEPLTDYTLATTDAGGSATTTTFVAFQFYSTVYEYDSAGKPTKTNILKILSQPQKTTLTNAQGVPTATEDYYVVVGPVTLFDSNNNPTATVSSTMAEKAVTSTLLDEYGIATATETVLLPMTTLTKISLVPTPTAAPNSDGDHSVLKLHTISEAKYFAGLLLPTLITIAISIPIRILDQTARLYQPFHALALGATAPDSLCLETTGIWSFVAGFRSMRRGEILLGITGLLVLLSAVIVPFSAEVFRMILQGPDCRTGQSDELICSVVMGVYPAPAIIVVALLVLMLMAVTVIAARLRGWRSGVERNPWSLMYMAGLTVHPDVRDNLERLRRRNRENKPVGRGKLAKVFGGKTFGLEEYEDNGVLKYGVRIRDEAGRPMVRKDGKTVTFMNAGGSPRRRRKLGFGKSMPFFILTWTGRILFLLLLSAVLIAVLTYDIIARGSEYERGLTGKAVGVRFLFTGAGVLVALLWGSFFYAVAFLSPHRLLHSQRVYKGQAIYLMPPTNPFSGLIFALKPLSRDPYLCLVAASAIIAEILPLLLGNIPCNGIQAYSAAETVCTWMSVTVLCVMILTVAGSFFVNWPEMLVDPSTIAGAMYYACAHILAMSPTAGQFFGRLKMGV